MSSRPDDREKKEKGPTGGSEPLEEEPSGGSVSPSPELEEALREATEAVEARHAERDEGETGGGEAAEPELSESTGDSLADLRPHPPEAGPAHGQARQAPLQELRALGA